MKLSSLLSQREALLRQARLANLALAWDRLETLHRRLALSGVRGKLRLRQAAPEADHYLATLSAIGFNQSVVDELFSDEDIMELADIVGFLTCCDKVDVTFHTDDIIVRFLRPLERKLARAGVEVDQDERPLFGAPREAAGISDWSHADEAADQHD